MLFAVVRNSLGAGEEVRGRLRGERKEDWCGEVGELGEEDVLGRWKGFKAGECALVLEWGAWFESWEDGLGLHLAVGFCLKFRGSGVLT